MNAYTWTVTFSKKKRSWCASISRQAGTFSFENPIHISATKTFTFSGMFLGICKGTPEISASAGLPTAQSKISQLIPPSYTYVEMLYCICFTPWKTKHIWKRQPGTGNNLQSLQQQSGWDTISVEDHGMLEIWDKLLMWLLIFYLELQCHTVVHSTV